MKKNPTRAKKVKRSRKGKEPQWRPMHLSAEAVERLEKLQGITVKSESIPRDLLGRFPTLFGEPANILASRLGKQSLEGVEAEGARIKAMFNTLHGIDALYSLRKTDTVTVNLPDAKGDNSAILSAVHDPAFLSGIKAGELPILAAPTDLGKSALYRRALLDGDESPDLTLEQARAYTASLAESVNREDVQAFLKARQPHVIRLLEEGAPQFHSMSANFPPLPDPDMVEDVPFCEHALSEHETRKKQAAANQKRVTRQMDRNEYYVRYGVDMPDTMHFCGPDVTPVECPVCRAYQFTKDSMALRYIDLRNLPESHLRRSQDMLHGELECRSCHHRFSYRLRTHNVVEVDKTIANQKT